MTSLRIAAIASLGFVVGVQPLVGQSPFAYRAFALESSVAAVAGISGARATDTKTLHVRPARIQELEWRAAYVRTGREPADPVRDVLFGFYDDQLYRVVVTYHRDRMEGLTNEDVIESISATYGMPLLRNTWAAPGVRPAVPTEMTIVAQWEDAASLLTLTRGTYSTQFQLELVSKALNARAGAAIKEALRLDTQEAPQRELDQRKRRIEDASVANQKARVINKAAFRP